MNQRQAYAILDSLPSIVWSGDRTGAIDWFNRRWYAYTGLDEARSLGIAWRDAVHPNDRGCAQLDGRVRLRARDGSYRWFLARNEGDPGASGRLLGSYTDIDAELRATEELAFYASLGEALGNARELADTLAVAVRAMVPRFGDWAFIDRVDRAGVRRIAAVHHDDPAKAKSLRTLVGRRYASAKNATPIPPFDREQSPRIVLGEHAGFVAPFAEPWAEAVFREVGFRATVVIPIALEGAIAALHVVRSQVGEIDRDDVPLLVEVGRRIGPAMVRAEAFERERKIATTFQQAALPLRLPLVPGVDFAALYQPGSSDVQVGGDFYDAFVVPDGRVVIAIGDVSGSGLGAAVMMSDVRQSIRGAAAVNPEPAILLDAADRAVRGPDHGKFVTAWVGVLDPVEFTLAHASAGHQPPLLATPDGAVVELEAGGLPLGLRGLGKLDEVARVMPLVPGSMLLLYTDGLTESTHDLAGGERRLREAFAATAIAPPEPTIERSEWLVETGRGRPWRLALEMRERMLDGGHGTDDVAIFVAEFIGSLEATGVAFRACFLADDSVAAGEARASIIALLEAYGTSDRGRRATELAFAELVGNVARHAGGEADVVLDMSGEQPVLHVCDRGAGFGYAPKRAVDAWKLEGRGLLIVGRLAAHFSVSLRYGGGSHARFVVPERTHGAFRTSEPALTP